MTVSFYPSSVALEVSRHVLECNPCSEFTVAPQAMETKAETKMLEKDKTLHILTRLKSKLSQPQPYITYTDLALTDRSLTWIYEWVNSAVGLLSFHIPVSPLWAFSTTITHSLHHTNNHHSSEIISQHQIFNCMLRNNNHLIRVKAINSCYHCWLQYHSITDLP